MGPGGSVLGWEAGEGSLYFWPDRVVGERTQAQQGCCCGCHCCCCYCWWLGLGEWEGCENPECPQKSGRLEAPRSPRDGGGVVGQGGGVPQSQRRAPLRSLHPLGLPGRPDPSTRQGVVGGVRGGDRGVEGVRKVQVAGIGGEWQREPPRTVSDCCAPRAPGGPGGRLPAREFGNGQRRECLGLAPRPGDRCCCCCYCCWWWWCRGGQGAGKGRKARRRWLLLVKRWSPSATSELCSL